MSYSLDIAQQRLTAAQFTASNPVPEADQLCIETDTDRAKVGDGVTAWAGLSYITLSAEQRRSADDVWASMGLSDDRDETGGGGGGGVIVGLNYAYSSTTSASGIATGTFRLNNDNFGSATKLYIHDTDGLTYDQSDYWDLFTSGVITLHRSSPEGYVTFKVTRMVAQTEYHEFDVVRVGGATGFTNADEIRMAVTMDAPGVREFIADVINEGAGVWTLSYIHKDSMISTPSIVGESDTYFKISSPGNFPAASTHAVAQGADATNVPVTAACIAVGNSVDVYMSASMDASSNPLQLILKVFNT